MVVRNISQAKAELSALIEEVQKGAEVILAKSGKPVARTVAYRPGVSQDSRLNVRRNLDFSGFRHLAG